MIHNFPQHLKKVILTILLFLVYKPIISQTNFKEKNIKFSEPFITTDNTENDFKKLRSFFVGVKGKVEEYS